MDPMNTTLTVTLMNEVQLEANSLELLTEARLEADLEANGAGISKNDLRKVLTLTEADFVEEYTGDDLMAMLDEYCASR